MADRACSKCGKELLNGASFCVACGTPTDHKRVKKPIMDAAGINGRVLLLEDKILIEREGYGGPFVRLKGRSIPLSHAASVLLKPVGRFDPGYIQFVGLGQAPKTGRFETTRDENTVVFGKSQQYAFERLKLAVEERMAVVKQMQLSTSLDKPGSPATSGDKGVSEQEQASVEIKQATDKRTDADHDAPKAPSSLDDLERLASLRDKGIVTEDEFQQKKKQILGL